MNWSSEITEKGLWRKTCIVLKLHRKRNISVAMEEENLLSENIGSQEAEEFLKLYKMI